MGDPLNFFFPILPHSASQHTNTGDNSTLPDGHMRETSERQQCGGKQKPLQPSIEAAGDLNAAAHNGRFTPHCVSNRKFRLQLPRVALYDSAIGNCGLSLPGTQQPTFTTTTSCHGAMTRERRKRVRDSETNRLTGRQMRSEIVQRAHTLSN